MVIDILLSELRLRLLQCLRAILRVARKDTQMLVFWNNVKCLISLFSILYFLNFYDNPCFQLKCRLFKFQSTRRSGVNYRTFVTSWGLPPPHHLLFRLLLHTFSFIHVKHKEISYYQNLCKFKTTTCPQKTPPNLLLTLMCSTCETQGNISLQKLT